MYKIVPITFPVFGTVHTLTIKVLPFALFPDTITLHYQLSGDKKTLEDNLTLPEEVVAAWGTDDSVVLNYVLATLDVELAPDVPAEEPEAGE